MIRYLLLGAMIVVSACANQPSDTQDADDAAAENSLEPIRFFEKVGEPRRETRGMTKDPDNLSTDVERLQDARRAYEAERDFQAAQTRHRQKECRESGEGKEVPIEDGSENPATYCQQDRDAGAQGQDEAE